AALAVVVSDPVDLHQANARLDQPPRQQAALAEGVPAVAVAGAVRLARQVERLLRRGRADQVERPGPIGVYLLRGGDLLFEAARQGATIAEALRGQFLVPLQGADGVFGRAGVTVDQVGVEAGAEEAGVLAGPRRADGRDELRHHDEGWHAARPEVAGD